MVEALHVYQKTFKYFSSFICSRRPREYDHEKMADVNMQGKW